MPVRSGLAGQEPLKLTLTRSVAVIPGFERDVAHPIAGGIVAVFEGRARLFPFSPMLDRKLAFASDRSFSVRLEP
jgi:hypothetical protein